jgi:integrase
MNMIFKSHFAQNIQDMLEYKKALGHNTSSYSWNLQNFDRFCRKFYPDETVLTQELAFAWCNAMENKSKSSYRMHAIREFGKFLAASGIEAYVFPTMLIGNHRAELPYLFTDEELKRFFAASDKFTPRKTSPVLEYTIPVIFRLQYGCGLRPQEARLLKRKDFDYKAGTIYITEAKRFKDRRVAVDNALIELCRRYDVVAEMIQPGRTYFFESPKGKAYTHGWMTAKFHQCWKLAQLDNKKGASTPYDFRHNFATRTLMRWAEEGKDFDAYLPYLSTYMGHASFTSTYYYVHLLPKRLSKMDFVGCKDIIPEV